MSDDRAYDEAPPPATLLAEEIKRRRNDAKLSQPQLAQRIGYTRQYVSLAERPGHNLPSLEVVKAIDEALDARGELLALRERARAEQQRRRRGSGSIEAVKVPGSSQSVLDSAGVSSSVFGDTVLACGAGRFFLGASIDVKAFPADIDERVISRVPLGFADDPFVRRPRRGLVVGVVESDEGPALYGLDSRQARRRLANASPGTKLLMSRAYLIDDLAMAVLWSVANLDEALLDDDAALAEASAHLAIFEDLPRSVGGRDLAADLAPVSRMWLGSNFCAQHILRHADSLSEAPVFWTREQRGEEASTWLFFAHKFDYLRRTATNQADLRRTFCVPNTAVTGSSRPERVLLLLAVALMESFDIQVDVVVDPEYGSLDGFVADRRRAVVANWMGADGIWQVDITDHRPKLREFHDALNYARAHSMARGATAHERLRELAEYLQLDWTWLTRRCAELGEYGAAGLAEPRSRLLSLEGLERACRFVGSAAGRND
ncbi:MULTISPECIES: helix-turn-helix transcriptional regulator [Saccharothrix]|uniref:helix-turn-helix transcriptional regulator n=1 Tax=Saccharothrix TaxID=2071 RepID=UPI00093D9C15|nr:helix-turn-helix transcriptional regulator [Saccharothrix sp. CB00851]